MSDVTPPVQPAGESSPEPAAEAVVDLLGMLAYGELVAFDRMAADARLAPDLRRRAVLSEMAAREITNFRRMADRLGELGIDPEAAMRPYVRAVSDYHEQTEPNDWLEGLTKAYVGDGIADDFTREVASVLTAPDRDLILDVLHDSRHADFAADELRAAIAIDPKVANRLSMWARRLVGEGISQALRVAGERPSLTALLAINGTDFQALLKRLTSAHTARMGAVGLNN
ncbi:ferritin-like fold-containing protein [Dactylosporangium darangshiense]|uniref:Ferritin-like domain-containing protein n=1 Tax=Dactylosporangium darangshiense TaxID=579108 RepID=A0ABP8D701_9ACTN